MMSCLYFLTTRVCRDLTWQRLKQIDHFLHFNEYISYSVLYTNEHVLDKNILLISREVIVKACKL